MWLASHGGPFELVELKVQHPKLAGLTVLHISDAHLAPGQTKKLSFIKELAKTKPDLVVNTGDNLGQKQAIPFALQALEPLAEFPGVFVNGSNDYRSPKAKNPLRYLAGPSQVGEKRDLDTVRFTIELENFGWLNLNNQRGQLTIQDRSIGFVGVDDPHENLDDFGAVSDATAGAKNIDVLVGVAHAPYHRIIDGFDAAGVDLMFSGHTHGGQICLPWKKAIVTNCDLEREYASGLSAWGERQMLLHVSSGLGQSSYAPIRLFCPPGATLISFS